MKRLEVCLSPALLHLYDTVNVNVVIIDVFRATSTICAALHNGAASVIPVNDVEECISLGSKIENSITAGERDGKIAPGLQYGNSPSEFPPHFIKGKNLVLTTTNGTRLLHMIKGARNILIGSFLNLDSICDYLLDDDADILLACASWKDRFNLEDTLFAGAVTEQIGLNFEINCDSARAARYLYRQKGPGHLIEFLKDSSHYIRLSKFGLQKDMEYCVTPNLHPVVPILKDDKLVIL
jgi:2-phosphosulfolactate phosphatase